jgi:hypothetical protein
MKSTKIITILFIVLALILTTKMALGAVVINEIMPNPGAVDNNMGEYVELYNDGNSEVNIEGWTLEDEDGDSHEIEVGEDGLFIAANSYFVLCNNDNINDNGGFVCDYQYDNFVLDNEVDEIKIMNGPIIDSVEYNEEFPFSSGISMELIEPSLDNNEATSWREATKEYGMGDLGTPGITNNNIAPTITNLENQSAVENGDFSLTIQAQDADNEEEVLEISIEDSELPTWMSVDSENKLKLVGIPSKNDIGEHNVLLVVKDSINGKSEAVEFTVTVKPGFEILSETLKVNVEGTETIYNETPIEAAPGDEVSVSFNYKNNLDASFFNELVNLLMGNVKIDAYSDLVPDFVEISEDYDHLSGEETATTTIIFNIPETVESNNLPVNEFSLSIDLAGETDWTYTYQDNINLEFEVVKKNQAAHIVESSLMKENFTCSKIAVLNVEVENLGQYPHKPRILVFDEPASLNSATGELTSSNAIIAEEFFSETPIEVGVTETLNMQVNLSEVTATDAILAKKLYIYLVSDFFVDGNGNFYVGDEAEVEITKIDSCFNHEVIEQELLISKNGEVFTLDLLEKDEEGEYLYLNEDKDEADDVTFEMLEEDEEGNEIESQTNKELIDCSITNNVLECEAPAVNQIGTSELTISFNKEGFDQVLEEMLTLNVNPEIGFTLVEINGNNAEIIAEGITAKLLEELEISFKLKNFAEEELQKIVVSAEVEDNAFSLEGSKTFASLEADAETNTEQLKVEVPLNTPAGTYQASLKVSAFTLDDIEYTDIYDFDLTIEPEKASILLSAQLSEGSPTEVTCNNDVELEVTYTNTGIVKEGDIVILVKDNSEVVWNSTEEKNGYLSLSAGSEETEIIPLTVSNTAGTHTYSIELKYNFVDEENAAEVVSTSVDITKNSCLGDLSPTQSSIALKSGIEQEFSVMPVEEDFDENKIDWEVTLASEDVEDGEIMIVESGTGNTFTFSSTTEEVYLVKVVIDSEEFVWEVTITDKPVDLNTFGVSEDSIIDTDSVENLVLTKNDVSIAFQESVDLSEIGEFTPVVKLEKLSSGNRLIAIDSTNAPELNVNAVVTLYNFPAGTTLIYKYEGFGELEDLSNPIDCIESNECANTDHSGTTFTFEVDGFSTYQIFNVQEAVLELPNEVLIENVQFGEAGNTTVTLKNSGTLESISGLSYDLSSINEKYNAILSEEPTSLTPGEEIIIGLQITIPEGETAGKHSIGNVMISWSNNGSASVPVYISPKSFLSIESIKINGKTTGDFTIEEDNEIKVKVQNDYTEDMEDVEVTVEILDVDGDDLDESEDIGDLDVGDDDEVTLTFDLSSEDIDQDSYEIRVTVTGTAIDDSEHETIETKTADIDIEKHKVVIDQISLSPSVLECSNQASLSVTAENLGKNDEDELEIRVSNTALGFDQSRDNIDIDKYFDSDNTEKRTFSLDLGNAEAGTYPITVQLYLDGDLEDSDSVSLTKKDCSLVQQKSSSQTQTQLANQQMVQELQNQLEQQLQTQSEPISQSNTVKGTFRESSSYLFLLAILGVLVLIALLLAIVVMIKKPKK